MNESSIEYCKERHEQSFLSAREAYAWIMHNRYSNDYAEWYQEYCNDELAAVSD